MSALADERVVDAVLNHRTAFLDLFDQGFEAFGDGFDQVAVLVGGIVAPLFEVRVEAFELSDELSIGHALRVATRSLCGDLPVLAVTS